MASRAQTRPEHPPAALRLILLGTPRLELADGTSAALERLMAALLAMLAIDGPLPRAHAARLLWPEADDKGARNNLRQRLFRLRQAAQRDVIVPEATLALADGITHDLADLGVRLAADPEAATSELLGALNFDDCLELADWVTVAREQWALARRNALAEIASRLESEGQIAPALRYAERLVSDDPLLEHAHRRLMRLHYLRGDRAAALTAYERCRDVLRRELKSAPSQETLDLARTIDESRAPLPGAPMARSVTVLRPPRLIGRGDEWRAIEAAWQQQRLVLVFGEPGIGKSRLAGDWAGSVDEVTLVGARPGDARVPYAALARILRRLIERWGLPKEPWVTAELTYLLPELGAAPARKMQTLQVQQAVAQTVGAAADAGLAGLVIDDLHFADEASLECLLWMMTQASGQRLRWLLTLRANEVPTRLAEWRARVDTSALTEMRLGPLDDAAVRTLLESLAIPDFDVDAWAAPMARHTGGNPMFILETLLAMQVGASAFEASALKLPAPANIGQLIERRLDQLSAPALRLARVAALAGQDFSVDLAASVLGQHALDIADAWRELEAAQVIRDQGFAHDLIFEATLRTVPRPIAQVLHVAIGDFLEHHGAPAARIAHHWVEAAKWRKAAEQFNLAARASFDASRFPESGEHFRSAAACFERAGAQAEQHSALQELAGCQIKAFDLTGAREVAEQLKRISVNDDQLGWALDRLIDTLNMGRQDDDAASVAAEEMRRRGEASNNRWMEFNATRKLAVTLAHRGRFDDALALFGTQSDWIEANLHEWNVHVWLCDNAYVLDLSNQLEPAIEAYRRAEALARQHQNWWVVYVAMRNVALTSAWSGRLDVAVATSDEAVHFSERLGDALVARNPRDSGRRAALLWNFGRLSEALTLLEDACAILGGGGSDYWLAYCLDQLALLHLQLGQPGRSRDLPGELPRLPTEARISRWIVRSRLARALGQKPQPVPAGTLEAMNNADGPARWLQLAMLERAREIEPEQAIALCARIGEQASSSGFVGIRLHASALAADRAAECDAAAAAGRFAAEAMTLARQFWPTGMSMAEVMWCIHRGCIAANDAAGAAEALKRGIQWIETAALPNVPAAFRDSFLDRNPIHRSLLTAASRRVSV